MFGRSVSSDDVLGKQKDIPVERGNVYWMDIPFDEMNPGFKCGFRPVVVVSNDEANTYSGNINVCPTSSRRDKYWYIHPEVNLYTGKESFVLTENIRTVEKSKLKDFICKLTSEEMKQVDDAMKTQLNLKSRGTKKRKADKEKIKAHAYALIEEIFK